MNENIKREAQALAKRQYAMFVFLDSSVEEEPVYIAVNPEIEGCFAEGETPDEAAENLSLFRADLFEHLIGHDLPIPDPIGVTSRPETAIEPDVPEQEESSLVIVSPETENKEVPISGRIAAYAAASTAA